MILQTLGVFLLAITYLLIGKLSLEINSDLNISKEISRNESDALLAWPILLIFCFIIYPVILFLYFLIDLLVSIKLGRLGK